MPFESTYFLHGRIGAYDAALQRLCSDSGVQYLDVSRALAREDLQDGLHPNDAGHEKMFRHILNFFDTQDLLN